MEWYFWFGIYVVGILAYFGVGRFIAKFMGEWSEKKAAEKKAAEKKGKEFKGLSRPSAWIITIGWPLYAVVIILGVGYCLLLIGFVIAVVLSLIAIALGLVGIVIGVIVGLLAFVIAVIIAILALALGLVPLVLIAIIILSPIDGLTVFKGIITKFNPLPWSPPEKEKEEK